MFYFIQAKLKTEPLGSAEQEHLSLSNAILHNSAAHAKHTRTHVGLFVSAIRVVIGQHAMGRSLMDQSFALCHDEPLFLCTIYYKLLQFSTVVTASLSNSLQITTIPYRSLQFSTIYCNSLQFITISHLHVRFEYCLVDDKLDHKLPLKFSTNYFSSVQCM